MMCLLLLVRWPVFRRSWQTSVNCYHGEQSLQITTTKMPVCSHAYLSRMSLYFFSGNKSKSSYMVIVKEVADS